MPAAPIIVAAAVGSGAAAALGAAVVGAITAATISTAVATAVGVGVISGVSTAVQGGDSSDILRSAVIGGVSSYVGGQVASKVTSSVASQTGASLVDLEPSLRALSGEGATAAGIASITAGNVAGAATSAAITGQPIEQAALFGLAQSIPTALSGSQDFQSLNPVVQNVLASSAQAAVMGQDVGDAAIASLVASSGIVARAINEVPGGQEFIQNNPIYAKYVIDSVSSALTAQLQGKDVSESVIYSLARTTADVLSQEFQNSQKAKEVEDANAKYAQAQQVEQETLAAQQQINDLVRQNQTDVTNYNYYKDRYKLVYTDRYAKYDRRANDYESRAQRMRDDPFWMSYEGQFGRTPEYYDQLAQGLRQQRDVYIDDVNQAVAGLNQSYEKLQAVNFFDEYKTLNDNFNRLNNQLTALTNDIQIASQSLANASANLFTDFETEIATNIAPLTAFEDVTDVGDQDVLAEIQPVMPPTEVTNIANITPQPLPADLQTDLAQSLPSVANQIANLQTPNLTFADVDSTVKTFFDAYKSFLDAANANVDEESKQSFTDAANIYLNLAKNREQEILNGSSIRFIEQPVAQTPAPVEVAETPSLIEELAPEELVTEAPITNQEIAQEMLGGGQLPTDIGVEVAGDVNRDAIRGTFVVPFAGETFYQPDESVMITPEQGEIFEPFKNIYRYVSGTKSDGTPYFYMISIAPELGLISYIDLGNSEDIVTSRQASYDAFAQYDKDQPDQGTNVAPEGWGLTGIGEDAGAGVVTEAPTGVGTDAGIGTGTPGAPPIDYSLAATEMQGTPLGEQPPFPTIGLNLLTAGTGIEGGRNRALFNTGGGFGFGGNTTETTWSIVARASETGTNDIVDVGGKLYSLILLPDKQVLVPEEPSEVVVYIERDLTTDLPRMREVPTSSVPPQEAQQIAEKVGQTAGGAPAGAEGAAGGRTAEEDRVATTEEQLQPGARPEEVAPGVVAEQPAPSFPELISGITEPTVPAPVPGQVAGTQTGTQAPGAGGFGDQISDEDIIRLIQGEIGTPGGGEGEGAPGKEGAGVGEGEEGVGPGAGEEGEGEGVAGEGEGTGEGVGPGTGEGGGVTETTTPTPEIVLPSPVITTVNRRTFQRLGEAAPYRVTGMDESGILGRKQPLFGGDEDLQRAEWNRRSLRLKRLLGL